MRILVINPNSNQAVTAGISAALDEFRQPSGPEIDCITLSDGPFGVESQADIDAVAPLLRQAVEARDDYDAYIVACYSDPGLQACRTATDKPVYGIQESAVSAALAQAPAFGVAAIAEASIKRHLVYLDSLGASGRLAGERPLNMSVAQTGDDQTLPRLIEVAIELRDEDGAGVVILGCTGMARHRVPLQAAIGIPVIDPTQAAVARALEEF